MLSWINGPTKINKLMQGSLTTCRKTYRAISDLFFSSFKFKASPEGLKIKK